MIKNKPTQGLFSAFYVHFLDRWGDLRHPKYDLSTRKLIYRNDKGIEVERLSFAPGGVQRATGTRHAGALTQAQTALITYTVHSRECRSPDRNRNGEVLDAESCLMCWIP